MKKRTILIQVLFILTLAPALTFGQTLVGVLTYLEGDVSILRDDEIVDDLPFGGSVYTGDVVQTEADSYAEIEITGSNAGGSTVRIDENSAYYVEEYGQDTNTKIRLLTGSIHVAVEQIRPGNRFSVQTNTVILGVRGTTFDVLTSPDDKTLLGVREGVVALDANGKSVRATVGSAVEAGTRQDPRLSRVPGGDFDQFYQSWQEARMAAFRSGAATFVQAYARRYLDMVDDFNEAFDDLVQYRSHIERALSSDLSMGDQALLKRDMGPALIHMRSLLPLFENTIYRLRELRRYHDRGIGRTTIDGVSSTDFFNGFSGRENRLLGQLSITRHIFELYKAFDAQSFGGMPGSGMPSSNMPSSSFPGTTNF